MNNDNILRKLKGMITILILVILSYFFVFQMLRTGAINNGDDAFYHVNRILEIRAGIKSGNWLQYVYPHSNGMVAFPLGIFYPEITLIPLAAISLFFSHPVTGIYMGMAFYTFVTLLIMYLVLKKLGVTRIASFLGSLIYAFSIYRTLDAFTRFALGEYLAFTFFPLVFYGFYSIVKENYREWPYLSLGIIGVVLSHVLSTLIVIVCLVVVFLLTCLKSKQLLKKISYLILSSVVSILGSLIFLIPFLEQLMVQKYSTPSPLDTSRVAQPMSDLIIAAMNNSLVKGPDARYSIGIVTLIILVLGLVRINTFSNDDRFIYWTGLVGFVSSSNLFPWFLVQHTPLSVIQWPFRLLIIPTLCLSIIGAKMIDEYIISRGDNLWLKIILIVGAILISWSTSINSLIKSDVFRDERYSYDNNGSYLVGTDYFDQYVAQYTPAKALPELHKSMKHIAVVNGKEKRIKVSSSASSQLIKLNKVDPNQWVELPISYYANFVAKQGDNFLETKKSNHRLAVKVKNSETVEISYQFTSLDKFGYVVSILTWILLIVVIIFKSKLRINV